MQTQPGTTKKYHTINVLTNFDIGCKIFEEIARNAHFSVELCQQFPERLDKIRAKKVSEYGKFISQRR